MERGPPRAPAFLEPEAGLLPAYLAYVERVMAAPSVAAALERARVRLDTYKVA